MTRMRPNLLLLFFGVITPVIVLSAAAYGQQSFEDEVRKRAAILRENRKLTIGDQTLYGAGLTLRMLELSGFNPSWNEKNTQALFAAIDDLDKDGSIRKSIDFPK